ncbi:MAG: hypothetical protein QM691_17910 [Opitutaceae bacterium]
MQTSNHRPPSSRENCAAIEREFTALADRLRRELEQIDEPQFKALCETSAEVLGALRQSFAHYVARAEPAWRAA